jgi:hypothetical protein
MQSEGEIRERDLEERKAVYEEIRDAFAEKYSFLGAQVAREMLLSAASWNIQEYSDPPMRFRNHVMLTWKPGWLKSSMLRKMKKVLGDDMVSTCGKLTAAVLRGSVDGGRFSPPKPLRTPIVVSTEFGQTTFEDELLNTFLALLEEGKTNVSLNKLAGLSEGEKENIENKYGDSINFRSENEFDLNTNFVFWGATHDPAQLNENALKSRFNVVTPAKPLTGKVTEAVDSSPSVESLIDQSTLKACRRMIKSSKEVPTDFQPPSSFYEKYTLTPRESRDVQAYMAARNWWGLEVNPDVMENYIDHMKHSRRIASMGPRERVLNLIFDNPHSYEEIMKETGLSKVEVHKILQQIDASKAGTNPTDTEWVVRSGAGNNDDGIDGDENDLKEKFLGDL